MNRHVALAGALTALALLLPATAAMADVVVRVTSPEQDAVVRSANSMALEVATGYDFRFECPETVQVRLLGPTNKLLYDTPVDLAARNDCEFGTERRTRNWAGASLEPRTLAPFAEDTRSCNGGYGIEATARWSDQRRVGRSHFLIQLPPSAPSDVTVKTGVERATIEWSPAPEPDVTGYRILRGDSDDPDWETVVGPNVTTVEDADAPAGKHEYRVATLRADGLVDGEPVKPCTDEGRDLQTTSAAVPATVDPPATESESETSTETESETATETTSPEATRTPTPTPDDEPEPEPVPVETTERSPEPTEVETTDPEYDEQLDFSGVGPSSPDDDPDGGAVALDVPGGSSEMDQLLGPILRPIAGGMILLVFALHLRRWSRDVW